MMYSSQYHNRRRPINKTVSMIKILTRFVMCSLKSPQFFMLAVQKSSNQKSKLKTQRSECLTEQGANGRFRGIFTEWRRLHMFPLWQWSLAFFLARFMAVKGFCVFCWFHPRLQQTLGQICMLILFIHIHIWLFESLAGFDSLWRFDPRHFLTLALNLNFLLLPLSSVGACGDASICQIILVLRKPPLLLLWYAARWRSSLYQGRNLWAP